MNAKYFILKVVLLSEDGEKFEDQVQIRFKRSVEVAIKELGETTEKLLKELGEDHPESKNIRECFKNLKESFAILSLQNQIGNP